MYKSKNYFKYSHSCAKLKTYHFSGYGIIKDITWLVWSEKDDTYLIIEAVTIKDWLYQFEKYIDWNTIKKG